MGQPDLTGAMQRILDQAVAQLNGHVPALEDSGAAWQTVADGLGVTAGTLRNTSLGVSDTWKDEIGTSCSEQLDGSAGTVGGWETALTAANLPAMVAQLGAAVRTTVQGIRDKANEYNQVAATVVADEAGLAALEIELAGIVQAAAAMLAELDGQFADAAARVSGASAGTAWDGPGAGAAAAAGAEIGGAEPAGAGAGAGADPSTMAATAPEGVGGGGSAPALVSPGATIPPMSPVSPGLAGSVPPLSPSPSLTPPYTPSLTPSLAGGAITPISGISPAGIGSAGLGGGGIGGIGGGIAPVVGAGVIPQAGRNLTGGAPVAGGAPAAGAVGRAPAGVAGSGAARGRLIPPLYGAGMHGLGGGSGGRPGPGDEADTHRHRPLHDVPGVPPALRGRTGPMAATPDFLTGTTTPADPAEPLREDMWEAERPPDPFHRR
ncbi:hypothetical protein AB0M54_14900 [Actinoplanes sp. NPDC051470]|uniref:hypothetical protein n=1 Tax=Actinoplanes sp. NPDC051470 TaxID=3157224 RepID=UPI003435AF7D